MGYFKGIDVSQFQKVIDWSKAENEIDFAMIRAGYGQGTIDPQFIRNITECNRLGIPCGAYWYSEAYTVEMARKEAEFFLAAVKPYKLQLPLAFDWEYASYDNAVDHGVTPTMALATAMCHAFCETLEKAGYYAMNYTNLDYLSRFYDATTTQKHDLWCAAWKTTIDPNAPPRTCGIWQPGTTTISGISGKVDLDYAYKDYPTLIASLGLNNLGAETGMPEPVSPGADGNQTETDEDKNKTAFDKLVAAGLGPALISIADKIK